MGMRTDYTKVIFIPLTCACHNKPVYINPEHIISIADAVDDNGKETGGSYLVLTGDRTAIVTENAEVIFKKMHDTLYSADSSLALNPLHEIHRAQKEATKQT